METPGGAAAHDQQVGGQENRRRHDGVLLREEAGHEERQRQDAEGQGARRLRFPGVQEQEQRAENPRRRQELGPPDHLSERLGVRRVDGEQQGRPDRGEADDAPRDPEDEQGVQQVQKEVDRAERERPQPRDGVIQRERQDGHRTVETRHLHVPRGPVAAQEQSRRLGQVADPLVLLDDLVVVVDEAGPQRRQVDQETDRREEEHRAPSTGRRGRPRPGDHGFRPPT